MIAANQPWTLIGMTTATSEIELPNVRKCMEMLQEWLARRLSTGAMKWLEEQIWLVGSANRSSQLGIGLGVVPRKLEDTPLGLNEQELVVARNLRNGLDPRDWTIAETGRMLLVLARWKGNEAVFASTLDKLFASADQAEQVALLRGFAFFPAPALLLPRAIAASQSSVKAIVEAIVHNSPYPRDHFNEEQWNRMVVNALHLGCRLAPIQDLDERRNRHLARMLIDYADECKVAGLSISSELWRCVGPFATKEEIVHLEGLLLGGCEREAAAAALALSECGSPKAPAALSARPRFEAAINARALTWHAF